MNNHRELTDSDWSEVLFGKHFEQKESLEINFTEEDIRMMVAGDQTEPLNIDGKEKCPICDHKIRLDYEDTVANVLSESLHVCDCCGLNAHYAYGNTEIWIEDFWWGIGCGTETEEAKAEAKQMREEQELVLRLYRKIHTGTELTKAESTELDNLALKMDKKNEHVQEQDTLQDVSGLY